MIVVLAFNFMFMMFSSLAAYHDFCVGRNGWGVAWCATAFLSAVFISFGIEEMIESSKKDKEDEHGQGTETN